MRERSTYEKVANVPHMADSEIELRFYPIGASPELALEHLVRQQILYLHLEDEADDLPISRDVKDRLLQKR